MDAAISIRPAQPGDAGRIGEIYDEGVAERNATFASGPHTADERRAWLAARGARAPVFCAVRGDEVVGWSALAPFSRRPWFDGVAEYTVYVSRAARGTGVGRGMLDHLIAHARGYGYWKLVGMILPENAPGLALAQGAGFRLVGTYTHHGRIAGAWRDVSVVERHLESDGAGVSAVLARTARIDYATAWDLQRRLAADRAADAGPEVVWLLEHDPVFTVGRHGTRADLFLSDEALAGMGAGFHRVDRGGQMTWHGPGQTTGYVIHRLRAGGVRGFVLALLESMAAAAGVAGARVDAHSMGVYVDGRKLGSVGIRVRNRVTYHGLALNRDPDLEWFRLMTACGAPGVPATSIAAEGGDPDRDRVESALAAELAQRLDLELRAGALPVPVAAI